MEVVPEEPAVGGEAVSEADGDTQEERLSDAGPSVRLMGSSRRPTTERWKQGAASLHWCWPDAQVGEALLGRSGGEYEAHPREEE